jgi:hypothetical protein
VVQRRRSTTASEAAATSGRAMATSLLRVAMVVYWSGLRPRGLGWLGDFLSGAGLGFSIGYVSELSSKVNGDRGSDVCYANECVA